MSDVTDWLRDCVAQSEAEEIIKCQVSNKTTQVVIGQVAAAAGGAVQPAISNIT